MFSALLLLVTNILVGYTALQAGWSVGYLLFVYWFQTLILGFSQIVKILISEEDPRLSLGGVQVEGLNIRSSHVTVNMIVAVMYIFIFSLYLRGTFLMLASSYGSSLAAEEIREIFIAAGLFLANHLASFFVNYRQIRSQKLALGAGMILPINRILPLQFIGILGSMVPIAPVVFIAIKTGVDLLSHIQEHRMIRRLAGN